MPNYIIMIKYTDQGMKDIKNTAQRTQANIKAFEALGGKVNAVFACMGEYDLIGFGEAPNDEVAMSFSLMVSSQGNARAGRIAAE